MSDIEEELRNSMRQCGRWPERANDCIEQALEAGPYIPGATWLAVLSPWYGTLTDEQKGHRRFLIEAALNEARRNRESLAKAELCLRWALEADE